MSPFVTPEKIEQLREIVQRDKCSLRIACQKLDFPYAIVMANLPDNVKAELRKYNPNAVKAKITDEQIAQVRDLMVNEGLKTIRQACEHLGIEYVYFMNHSSVVQRRVLPASRGARNVVIESKRYDAMVTPSEPVKSIAITKESISEPIKAGLDNIDFPKIIHRIRKTFIGKPVSDVARFFIRIEDNHYWVAGYEYMLPNEYRYQVDDLLYDFNTDLKTTLVNLRKKLSSAMSKEHDHDIHGKVAYGLHGPAQYNPHVIESKTPVDLPDGEYYCNISRDMATIQANGSPVSFMIAETIERRMNVPVVVKNKVGTLYL